MNSFPRTPLIIFCIISLVPIYFSFTDYTWNGWTRSTCYPHCYCEAPTGGPIEQLSNSFSNLCYILIGLLIIFHPCPVERSQSNLVSSDFFYPFLYGMNTIILGLGSFFYHGSLTEFGRFFDWFGMYLFASYVIVYNIARFFRPYFNPWRFFALFCAFMVTSVFFTLTLNADIRRHIFTIMIVIALVVAAFVNRRLGNPFDDSLLAFSLVSLIVAYIIWNLDNNGILCDPISFIQGHAIWHLLTAISIGCLLYTSPSPRD